MKYRVRSDMDRNGREIYMAEAHYRFLWGLIKFWFMVPEGKWRSTPEEAATDIEVDHRVRNYQPRIKIIQR